MEQQTEIACRLPYTISRPCRNLNKKYFFCPFDYYSFSNISVFQQIRVDQITAFLNGTLLRNNQPTKDRRLLQSLVVNSSDILAKFFLVKCAAKRNRFRNCFYVFKEFCKIVFGLFAGEFFFLLLLLFYLGREFQQFTFNMFYFKSIQMSKYQHQHYCQSVLNRSRDKTIILNLAQHN